MDVYSNAFNYGSYIGGSVDTRTGQYGCRIKLATLFPQGPLEVSRELSLGFSMLGAPNGLYGSNWHLSNTEFDVASSRLTLLNGEQFQTQSLPSVGGWLVIKDRKLKDLAVKREDANTLHVMYKDGTVEILRRTGSTTPYRIIALLFENGERFTWQYDAGDALARILNHSQEEVLVLTYSGGRLVMADIRVDGNRYARTRFLYTSGRLTSVTAPYDRTGVPGTANYTFGYTPAFRNGLVALNRVTTPMGGLEVITYVENGHQYGNGQYIPRVASWVQTAAVGQPDQTRTYRYSPDRNFTGYPYSAGFREGVDNLHLVASAYTYWTEESVIDASAVLSVTRSTYNKFHLLTEEQVRREGTQTTTLIAYNETPGALFPEQPANLQLPKRVTTRYELLAGGAAREEVVSIDTDDFGNEIARTQASGLREVFSYYPVAGEAGRCPADPHGQFQRYLKQEQRIPAGGTGDARVIDHTHTSLPIAGGQYVVLQLASAQADKVLLERTYVSAPTDPIRHGRLNTITSQIEGLALVTAFTYSREGDAFTETRRLQGREGQWLTSQRVLSLANRLLLSMTRDAGSSLRMVYDVAGRLVTETVSPGKPQQAGREHAYLFATETKGAHLLSTDAQGNRTVSYFDGAGRPVSAALILEGGAEQVTRRWLYDPQGRIAETTDIDYLPDGPRTLKTVHAHNAWGESSGVTYADGRVVIDDYDPRLNRRLAQTEGGARFETWYNAFGEPQRIERIDAGDNRVEIESRTYDGLGRCTSRLDTNKTRCDYFYDAFDRVVRTLETPAAGGTPRECLTEYAAGTSEALASSITVDGTLLGTRDYDSLGRLTRQARGVAQATHWEYKADAVDATVMISPRGDRQTFTYVEELDALSRVQMAGHLDVIHQHDPVTGRLQRSEQSGLIHELHHDRHGHLFKELQVTAGRSLTNEYEYSPGGRLLHHVAADGQRSEVDYDERGRFFRSTAGPLSIEQAYDNFGRAETLITTYDAVRLVTRIAYDAVGREAERRFEKDGALLQVMTSTYQPDSLLATRVLRNARGQPVIDERFDYDGFSRLSTYTCAGPERPLDEHGRGIAKLTYGFDGLDNLIEVTTVFEDGSTDLCQRFFTGADPTQLSRLTHTNPVQDLSLSYDAAGNLRDGPSGRRYEFNGFDQLASVQTDTHSYRYQYDGEARQVSATRNSEAATILAYAEGHLDTLVEGTRQVRYFNGEDQVLARSGGVDGAQLHVNDASGSVRGVAASGQAPASRHYTPYGDARVPVDDGKDRTLIDLQLPAFNGERLDASINLYPLGNGRRLYDPVLAMFLSPDPNSPFEAGGRNSYAYGAGNPINIMDPTGLWPNWLKWVLTGAALAAALVTLGVGAVGLTGALATNAAIAAGSAAAGTKAVTSLAIAGKALALAGSSAGVISGALSTATLSIEAVDKQMGWDRSQIIKHLGVVSFSFAITAWTFSFANAATAATGAYRAASAASKAEKFAGYAGFFDTPTGAALATAGKGIAGLAYRFSDKQGITTASQVFGVSAFNLRTVNLYRGIKARVKSGSPASDSITDKDAASDSASAQLQAVDQRVVDFPGSSARYYRSFREEAQRIRQPVWTELSAG